MLADFDAKHLQHLRPFSYGRVSRDTDGSNPPRSTSQSLHFRTSRIIARKARVCARLGITRGPGERATWLHDPDGNQLEVYCDGLPDEVAKFPDLTRGWKSIVNEI
jgi:hypothetical protein